MSTSYRSNTFIPEMVHVCKTLAEKNEFYHSCSDEVGRLLAVLVGQVSDGKILEIGTGLGVGSSWILSTIAPTVQFISIDNSTEKIILTRKTIKHNQVEFVEGDWKEIINRGPFKFVFVDAEVAKKDECEELFNILDIGGMLLIDDFTPQEHWPEEWRGKPDLVREFWLNHPSLSTIEVNLTEKSSAIIGTRITF